MDDKEPKLSLMEGLDLVGDTHGTWRVEAATIDVLRKALGDRVLVDICRCFALKDRIVSLLDLMAMNYDAAKHPKTGADTVRLDRNMFTLGVSLCSLVYELREVLLGLVTTDIESKLSEAGRDRWRDLSRHRKFKHTKAMQAVRNSLAFHAGDYNLVLKGIQRLSALGTPVVVMQSDGRRIADGRSVIGAEVTLSGMELEQEELSGALQEARDAHNDLLTALDLVFADLLRSAGADLGPIPPREPSDEPT